MKKSNRLKAMKKANQSKTNTITSAASKNIPQSKSNKRQSNALRIYEQLQDQMEIFLDNNDKKNLTQEKLSAEEQSKEFETLIKIFTKYESLSRKLEQIIAGDTKIDLESIQSQFDKLGIKNR